MGSKCYFCAERDRVGYWSYYCNDCAMLRIILLVYEPTKCIEILRETCLRDDKQIDYKISQEIKKIVNTDIETKVVKCDDDTHEAPPTKVITRSKRI